MKVNSSFWVLITICFYHILKYTNPNYTKRFHMKWLFCQQALFPNRVINFLVTFPRSYNPTIELNARTFLWCIGCHNIRQFLLVWRGDFIQTYFDRDAHAFYSILCVYSSFSRASYVKLLQCPQLLHLNFFRLFDVVLIAVADFPVTLWVWQQGVYNLTHQYKCCKCCNWSESTW